MRKIAEILTQTEFQGFFSLLPNKPSVWLTTEALHTSNCHLELENYLTDLCES